MNNIFTKEWLIPALNRAVRTMVQVALTMFTVGQRLTEIDWVTIISCSIVAGIYSLGTSVVLGIPEGDAVGTVNLDKYEGDDIMYVSDLKIDPEKLKEKSTVTFNVKTGGKE
jgi:hypothetical protein